MNGTRGDHPLTDIRNHGVEVYGEEADALIRKIAGLSGDRELDEWWEREIGWHGLSVDRETREMALRKARARHQELLERARERGWETER